MTDSLHASCHTTVFNILKTNYGRQQVRIGKNVLNATFRQKIMNDKNTLCDESNKICVFLFLNRSLWRTSPKKERSGQSELIGQCQATPHHLSDVRRGAPSWIWDYFSQSDVTICVLNAIYMLNFAQSAGWRNWPNSSDCVFFKMFR